jgi:hypothetical protein
MMTLFFVSCPKGQVEKYVNVEACSSSDENYEMFLFIYLVGYGSPPGSSFLPIGNILLEHAVSILSPVGCV